MAHPTVILNVVGLDRGLLRDHAPRLRALADDGTQRTIAPAFPAVTCTAQSCMLTGRSPSEHGIVGNGWYDRTSCEVRFWKQSNRLVGGDKIWETARRSEPDFTCSNMFWWYNMYSTADTAVTPRPMYPADGRKLPDIWTNPPELRDRLQRELGPFPLFHFWGPGSDLRSSRWIAEASRLVHEATSPDLQLVYLPHLDYGLQQLGPDDPAIAGHVREIDDLAGDLIDFYRDRGCRVLAERIRHRPGGRRRGDQSHPPRGGAAGHPRGKGRELLDAGGRRPRDRRPPDRPRLPRGRRRSRDGPAPARSERRHRRGAGQGRTRHPGTRERCGDLVCISEPRRWFIWDYGSMRNGPDFARTVDIHRKPGATRGTLPRSGPALVPRGVVWRLSARSWAFGP